MKERGILFRDRLVRRILDRVSPKTQTRRIVKLDEFAPAEARGYDWEFRDARGRWNSVTTAQLLERCPYGVPGDRLWVREAWRSWTEQHHDHHADDEPCDEHCRQVYLAYRATPREGFRAVPDRQRITYLHESTPIERNPNLIGPWKPGIHLRRDHARIWLDVVAVRVERLQTITEVDAIAEGVERDDRGWITSTQLGTPAYAETARLAFAQLWCSVNGSGPQTRRDAEGREYTIDHSWKANPWVWVVEFKRVPLAQIARAA